MNPAWLPWGQLVRLPAVFSVIAQITAAFLIAGGGSGHVVASWPRLALALVAGGTIYWAGMILNDIWDYDEDLRDRPFRPLPSGQISLPLARKVAFGLLGLSITIAAGFTAGGGGTGAWCAGLMASARGNATPSATGRPAAWAAARCSASRACTATARKRCSFSKTETAARSGAAPSGMPCKSISNGS